ncbi:replicative DNA helicase [Xanthobacteraceae bacterium A53D]
MTEESIAAEATVLEQELLGSLISTPEAMAAVATTTMAEHFTHPLHAKLFDALKERHATGSPSSPASLATDLHLEWNAPISDGLSMGQYVSRLVANAAPAMMVRSYSSDLRDLWAARTIGDASARFSGSDGLPDVKLRALFDEIDAVRAALSDAKATRETAGEGAAALLKMINSVRCNEVQPTSATTGFTDLDRVMLGYRPGELIVMGARPGMGKTTYGTSSLLRSAQAGNGVMFFSLELPREGLVARLLSDLAYDPRHPLTHSDIRSIGTITDEQFWQIQDATGRLDQLPFDIDYAPRLAVADLGARVAAARKRLARRGVPLRVVAIDYLKFLKATDRYRGQRAYEVGEITAGLLEIAKNEEVCIVLLAQLNRGIENEKDKRPDLHHLRESGDIEADANVVMFLYRDAYYIEKSPEYRAGDAEAIHNHEKAWNKLEVIVAKNRNGPTGTVDLFCDIGASAVRNLDWRHGDSR